MTTTELVTKTLKAGTVVLVEGIPLELAADTTVNTTEANFELIERLRISAAHTSVSGSGER